MKTYFDTCSKKEDRLVSSDKEKKFKSGARGTHMTWFYEGYKSPDCIRYCQCVGFLQGKAAAT